jgi:O-antigen/teichoic acid export membrane protein
MGTQTLLRRLKERLGSDSLLELLLRGSASSFLIRIVGFCLGFAAQLVTANAMTTASFGYFWYVVTCLNLASLVCTLGYGQAVVRFVPNYLGRNDLAQLRGLLKQIRVQVTLVAIVLLAAASLGLVAFSDRLHPEFRATLWWGALIVPIAASARVLEGMLRSLAHVSAAQMPLALFRPTVLVLGVIAYALFGRSVPAPLLMVVNATAYAAAALKLLLDWRRLGPSLIDSATDASRSRDWTGSALTMLLVSGFTLLLFQADIILLGIIESTTLSGKYIVATRIASVLVFVLTAINFIAGPMIAEMHSRNGQREIQRVVRIAVRASTLSSIVLGTLLVPFGVPILGLFGSAFHDAYPALLILIGGQIINAATGPVSLLLNLTGKHSTVAIFLGIGATLNLALNLTLIPVWQLTGAAVATAFTTGLVNIALARVVWKDMGISTIGTLLPSRPRERNR